jgi:2-dehydro-3-deoxy-L-rhamnonate dehydrogenase (NAD+)
MANVSKAMPVSYDFSGKVAVVTGGSKGIGRAICQQLKQSGVQVWNWDVSPAPHDGVKFQQVDVVDGKQIDDAISEVRRIDILVNNAGLLGPPVSVEQLRSADWQRVLDVNLTSVFEVCRRVVPLMKQSGWGRIVNMASVAAKEGSQTFLLIHRPARAWWRSRKRWGRNLPTRRFA